MDEIACYTRLSVLHGSFDVLSQDGFVGWIRRLRGIRQEHMARCKKSHLCTWNNRLYPLALPLFVYISTLFYKHSARIFLYCNDNRYHCVLLFFA